MSGISLPTVNITKFITQKSDFPSPTGGIITLESNTTYFILYWDINLTWDRLVCWQNTSIIGGSSDNSILRSTWLSAGTALITSNWTISMKFLSITHGTALNLNATWNANQEIHWMDVNFVNCATIWTIQNYVTFIHSDSEYINSQGITFTGTFDYIDFRDILFDCSTAGTSIILPSTLTISNKIEILNCSFTTLPGETSLNVSTSAVIPNDSYILDSVSFSWGGTYITWVQYNDVKALFINCKPINNTGNTSQYYMPDNTTATVVSAIDTFYKIAWTTTSSWITQKFTNTNNRATYTWTFIGLYKVTAYLTFTSGNANVVRARIAKNWTTTTSSESKSTVNAGWRSENLPISDILSLSTWDYIEVFVANGSAVNNITVSELNVLVQRLN